MSKYFTLWLILIQCYFSYSQPYEVINYKNKIRIQWPLKTNSYGRYSFKQLRPYKYNSYGEHIMETYEYIPLIIKNIDEIKYECNKGNPIIIDIIKNLNISQIRITNSNNPIHYMFADTTLIFTGYHHIRFPSNYSSLPVIISFDDPENLRELTILDFEKMRSSIKKIGQKENISFKLHTTKEVIFNHFDDQTTFGGRITRQTKSNFLINTNTFLFGTTKTIGLGFEAGLGYGTQLITDDGKKILLWSLNLDFGNLIGEGYGLTSTYGISLRKQNEHIGVGYLRTKDSDVSFVQNGWYLDGGYRIKSVLLNLRVLPLNTSTIFPKIMLTVGVPTSILLPTKNNRR